MILKKISCTFKPDKKNSLRMERIENSFMPTPNPPIPQTPLTPLTSPPPPPQKSNDLHYLLPGVIIRLRGRLPHKVHLVVHLKVRPKRYQITDFKPGPKDTTTTSVSLAGSSPPPPPHQPEQGELKSPKIPYGKLRKMKQLPFLYQCLKSIVT